MSKGTYKSNKTFMLSIVYNNKLSNYNNIIYNYEHNKY